MIEVEGLQKKFGSLLAVDGVAFKAKPGMVFGLLGPNGAGKTTTIGCVSGLLKPTAGRVQVLGHDMARDGRAIKHQLGVAPQELATYEDLSAVENLRFLGGVYGLAGARLKRRIQEVLSSVGLLDRADECVKRFSGRMKRRLNFACGIVHVPKVLLLDEPTAGVDPQSRVRLLELVRDEVARGACVLYTTHYLEEAEDLCDVLAIVDHGRIIAQGTLSDLRAMVGQSDVLVLRGKFDTTRLQEALARIAGIDLASVQPHEIRLILQGATHRLPEAFATARRGALVLSYMIVFPLMMVGGSMFPFEIRIQRAPT